MASLRSNGWAVTGKLRRDQPDIFAPGELLHHLQDAIVEAVKETMTRVTLGKEVQSARLR